MLAASLQCSRECRLEAGPRWVMTDLAGPSAGVACQLDADNTDQAPTTGAAANDGMVAGGVVGLDGEMEREAPVVVREKRSRVEA